MSILEAFVARLPVIATSVGDSVRIVHPGKTGILVAPERTSDLAEAMVQMHDNPLGRVRFGEAGRRLVQREYNLKSVARRVVSVYQEASAKQHRGTSHGVATSKCMPTL